MLVRPAVAGDAASVAAIVLPVIQAGATYALDPMTTEQAALAYWYGADRETFVAEEAGELLGTYYLRANQAGGGDHVCNCGYMVRGDAGGRGVARRMAQHSLARARERGFEAMQFNFVVESNARAVRLWRSLGFEVVGRLPAAFRHPEGRYVDALVMYRTL